MVNKNSITVKNQSGAQQHYAIFNKPPVVTGKVSGQIWSNVFATGNTPKGQQANFSVYKQYYAVVGTSQGSPQQGVEVDVNGSKDVTLGSTKPDGTAVPGTTLQLLVQDEAPQFSDNSLPDGSYPNAFEIQTGSDFTVAEAKNGNYLIGLGGTKNGNSIDGPAATFIPEPNVKYQIQPVNTYYLTVGDYTKGSLIDVTKIGGTVLTIDFTAYSSGQVTVVHNDRGQLVIQAQG
ncbi:Ff.00g022810.m01.CDS01 [Fusarium sp. VM40]|nr:Ff.00g022810.m01.CDS01 [Fusarium sp. VM40]